MHSNVYAAALEWLIENQSPTNPLFSEEQSSTMNLSSKFTNNVSVRRIKTIRKGKEESELKLKLIYIFIDNNKG